MIQGSPTDTYFSTLGSQKHVLLPFSLQPTDSENIRKQHLRWNARPFIILLSGCDGSFNSTRPFTLLAIRPPWWAVLAFFVGLLCRWSQIVVSINSPTQSPPITYTWPLRSERHTLDETKWKAQLDSWLKVKPPWSFNILFEVFLRLAV